MRIGEIIRELDELVPNARSVKIKTAYINDLEADIQTQVLLKGADEVTGHVAESNWNGTGIVFEDDHTMSAPMRIEVRVGGHVQLVGLTDCAENNGEYEVIGVAYADGGTVIRVPDGSFAQMGTETGLANIIYDGRTEELIAPDAFKKLYTSYLRARVSMEDGEFAKYANWMEVFNQYWDEFRAIYCERYVDKKGAEAWG